MTATGGGTWGGAAWDRVAWDLAPAAVPGPTPNAPDPRLALSRAEGPDPLRSTSVRVPIAT